MAAIYPNVLRTFVLFVVLNTSTEFCLSQTQIDYSKLYQHELKKYLNPPSVKLDTIELMAFRVNPEIDPNSSLRIIDVGGRFYIEAIFLDKNIWCELLPKISKHLDLSLNIKKETHQVLVSKLFKEKTIQSFKRVIDYENKNIDDNSQQIYDGISYDFYVYSNKNEITTTVQNIKEERKSYSVVTDDSFVSEIINTNLKIITDIKNNSFEETKYDIYK